MIYKHLRLPKTNEEWEITDINIKEKTYEITNKKGEKKLLPLSKLKFNLKSKS